MTIETFTKVFNLPAYAESRFNNYTGVESVTTYTTELFYPGDTVEGEWNYTKTHFMFNGNQERLIPAEYFEPITKYSKHFTLEQLYKPDVAVVPENEEQASELLTWFESTGKSKFIGKWTSKYNPEYYSFTYYHLHAGYSRTGHVDNSLKLIHWSDIPDNEESTMQPQFTLEYLNSDKCLIKINSHDDALYLLSIGVELSKSKFELVADFNEEVNEWGLPIVWNYKFSWGNLRSFIVCNLPIITIDQIKQQLNIKEDTMLDLTYEDLIAITEWEPAPLSTITKLATQRYLTNLMDQGAVVKDKYDNFILKNSLNEYRHISNNGDKTRIDALSNQKIEELSVYYMQPTASVKPKPTQVIWKNPKPNKPNTQPITSGQYYVVDGFPIPRYTETDFTEILSDAYPLHKLHDDQPIKIGDIIEVNGVWGVVKSNQDKQEFNKLVTLKSAYRITDENNKAIQTLNINRYSCGTIVDADTNEPIVGTLDSIKIKSDYKYDWPFEHFQISQHYQIPYEQLQAQDEFIHKQVHTALEHPLNIKCNEWVYLCGPSG